MSGESLREAVSRIVGNAPHNSREDVVDDLLAAFGKMVEQELDQAREDYRAFDSDRTRAGDDKELMLLSQYHGVLRVKDRILRERGLPLFPEPVELTDSPEAL